MGVVQDLVGGLIERFLEEAEQRPPQLAEIPGRPRTLETPLRAKGVAALWVFGSVARGDARPDSDVDPAIDFMPDAKSSLFQIVRIKKDVEGALGHSADVGERSAMTTLTAATAERDLVRVF